MALYNWCTKVLTCATVLKSSIGGLPKKQSSCFSKERSSIKSKSKSKSKYRSWLKWFIKKFHFQVTLGLFSKWESSVGSTARRKKIIFFNSHANQKISTWKITNLASFLRWKKRLWLFLLVKTQLLLQISFCFQHLILKSKFTKMTLVSDLLHFPGLERMANQCTMSGQILSLVDDWRDSQVLKSRTFIG